VAEVIVLKRRTIHSLLRQTRFKAVKSEFQETKMLKRIYGLVIAIVIIAVLVTGLVAFDVISQYNDVVKNRFLASMARVIEGEIEEGDNPQAAAEEALADFSELGDLLRVSIINVDGSVIYDNSADPEEMDNHLSRPEVAFALKNESTGSAIRTSTTLGLDMLYLAHYYPEKNIIIRTAMPLSEHRAGMNDFIRTAAIILLLVMAALGIIGAVMVRYLTRPLARLRESAIAMSKGDLSARVLPTGDETSEIAALSGSFNDMAEKLEKSINDLEERNARLDAILDAMTDPVIAVAEGCAVTFMNSHAKSVFGRDINPAKAVYPLVLITHSQATEEIANRAMSENNTFSGEYVLSTELGEMVYNVVASPIISSSSVGAIITFHDISEARRVQKMRSDFVANVTHELRTPLTSIRGFVETLRRGAINDRKVADRFLEIIDIEAERLNQLINDILVLSEIETVKEEQNLEKFDMNELMDDVAVLLDDMAAEQKVGLILNHENQRLEVSANRQRIKQILINLIDNAIKYNIEGGKVFVSACRLESGRLELKVADTGPGIAPEHQERVFERFYRIDKSRSREMGGTGLGLSIVKHIAQLYHGYASVRSEPGEGTTFTVVLDI
jgi:two-component system phosphate regulon sensor histidine kinase PhoR